MRVMFAIHCPECGKNLTLWGRKGSEDKFQCIYCKTELQFVARKWNLLAIQLGSYVAFIFVTAIAAGILKYVVPFWKPTDSEAVLIGATVLAALVVIHVIFMANFTIIQRVIPKVPHDDISKKNS
ncbi:MAG: hypothetical protein AB7V08_05095 [Elusimicrobiales bacterium]